MKKYTKVQFEMANRDWVEVMKEKIRSCGQFTSGTYNPADPTHYEKGWAEITMESGYTMSTPDAETGDPGGMPLPEMVKASFHDCTWGVDFDFDTTAGRVSGYYNRAFGRDGAGEWQSCDALFFKVFKDVLTEVSDSTTNRRSAEAELRRYE